LHDLRDVRVGPAGIPDWGVRFRLVGDGSLPTGLRQLVTGMRNAISHNHLEFDTDGINISGVSFEERSRASDYRDRVWQVSYDLSGLHAFLARLTTEVEEACQRRASRA